MKTDVTANELRLAKASIEKAQKALAGADMFNPDRTDLLRECLQNIDNAVNTLWGAAKDLEKKI